MSEKKEPAFKQTPQAIELGKLAIRLSDTVHNRPQPLELIAQEQTRDDQARRTPNSNRPSKS